MASRARIMIVGTMLVAAGFAGGCSSSTRDAAQTVKVAEPTAPTLSTGPLQLIELDDGIAAVAPDTSTPLWRVTGAVAALDGSAVFSIHRSADGRDQLLRLDRRTGGTTSTWSLTTTGFSISAVAPNGRWVALTNRTRGYGSQARKTTAVVVFDPTTGTETKHMTLTGDVQPEAFSVDGSLVFALDYHVGFYRVQTIELTTGLRYDTTDRDKAPPEDMHGESVHGVMSRDRTLLATLYRDPTDDDEPAFVHILDLRHGWSYCADLPAPFGTGAVGTDTIELTSSGTVVVAANAAHRLAEVHIDAVRTPRTPVRIAYRTGTIPTPSPALTAIPGFDYVLGTIPA